MALTAAQQKYVDGVFPKCRPEMADYLERGVEVVVYPQNECWPDVPPFAVSPKEDMEFWIGCWDSYETAAAESTALGLRVVSD